MTNNLLAGFMSRCAEFSIESFRANLSLGLVKLWIQRVK